MSTDCTVIPAGTPADKLESGEDKEILRWGRACREALPNTRLANEALKYWVRYFHRVLSPEHERICGRIDALIKDVARGERPSEEGEGSMMDADHPPT